jgi:lipopolysaccharide heptosyltransferase II
MIKPKNLLIVRTDRIGDVVLSLPLAEIIKRHFPDCKITFLIRDYTKDVVKNHPCIDDIILLKEKDGKILIRKNVQPISEKKFDSAIIVYPTLQTSLIIYLSNIRQRIGTGYRWYSFLFNNKIYEHRKYAQKHELEFNVSLLKKFGIDEEVNKQNVIFNLNPNEKDTKKVRDLMIKEKIDFTKQIIIVHPGSGGSAVDLPIEKLRELILLISSKLDSEIILTGSKEEKPLCDSLVINKSVKNFAGIFNLAELIALINFCSIFIANSTGPIHIAAALNKYIIGFYPKILACSPRRWGPYNTKSVIFSPKIDCQNCNREQCERLNCMSTIEVTDVFLEVSKIYKILVTNGEN